MCKCNPFIRTPFCGEGDCVPPKQERPGALRSKVDGLKSMIADAYQRMATNMDPAYHAQQMEKVNGWLAEMNQLYEQNQEQWIKEVF